MQGALNLNDLAIHHLWSPTETETIWRSFEMWTEVIKILITFGLWFFLCIFGGLSAYHFIRKTIAGYKKCTKWFDDWKGISHSSEISAKHRAKLFNYSQWNFLYLEDMCLNWVSTSIISYFVTFQYCRLALCSKINEKSWANPLKLKL